MYAIDAQRFDLNEARKVTQNVKPYYVFSADNGQKFIIMHGNENGSYNRVCDSALGTFKSAIVICCYPQSMREITGLNTIDVEWNCETTFAYDGTTVYVMAA